MMIGITIHPVPLVHTTMPLANAYWRIPFDIRNETKHRPEQLTKNVNEMKINKKWYGFDSLLTNYYHRWWIGQMVRWTSNRKFRSCIFQWYPLGRQISALWNAKNFAPASRRVCSWNDNVDRMSVTFTFWFRCFDKHTRHYVFQPIDVCCRSLDLLRHRKFSAHQMSHTSQHCDDCDFHWIITSATDKIEENPCQSHMTRVWKIDGFVYLFVHSSVFSSFCFVTRCTSKYATINANEVE